MESGNILSIISKLINLSKEEKEMDHLTKLRSSLAKEIGSNPDENNSMREFFMIPVTRELALEKLRYLN
jgi:hypothetical protein